MKLKSRGGPTADEVVPVELRRILERLLCRDQNQRPTAQDIVDNPFIADAAERHVAAVAAGGPGDAFERFQLQTPPPAQSKGPHGWESPLVPSPLRMNSPLRTSPSPLISPVASDACSNGGKDSAEEIRGPEALPVS